MILQIPFPDLSPEIFTIELGGFAFALRWYALAYIVGIVIGWRIVRALMARPALWPGEAAPLTQEAVDDLLTWIVAGVILGGRLGYVLFYQPGYYLAHPGEVLFLWQGGMAFHGGMLGVVAAIVLFSRRQRARILSVADALAIATPPGLMLGRIANFINAELWGRPTDLPWGVIFPGMAAQDCAGVEGPCARHPSQLYEAGLEGVVLFALLLVLLRFRLLKRPGMATGVFLAGYGIARMIVEHFRQADPQFISADNPLGHVLRLGEAGLSMGQILSLPMVVIGGIFILYARRWKA